MRVTTALEAEQEEYVLKVKEAEGLSSNAAAVRACIDRAIDARQRVRDLEDELGERESEINNLQERVDDLERERDRPQAEADRLQERVDDLEDELDSVRAARDDLRRQLQQANRRQDETAALARYVERERQRERERERASIATRAKWWVFGRDVDDE